MTALILSAMKEELEALRSHLQVERSSSWGGLPHTTGFLFGRRVTVGLSGVGKTLSAAVTQRLCEQLRPEFILFSGLAGAINPAYRVGDIVLGGELVQHDMDASPLGFSRGEIPFSGIRILQGSELLLERASRTHLEGVQIHRGRIATGDQFIASAERRHEVTAATGADAVDMEGAAVALVAHLNQIPSLVIRTISDQADGSAPDSFSNFLAMITKHEVELIRSILA